ncbi:MAG: hypothetical protein ACEQSX_08535 [Baekduiaceae bacterium]
MPEEEPELEVKPATLQAIVEMSREELAEVFLDEQRQRHRQAHEDRTSRAAQRRSQIVALARDALPNTIGTIVGGAVLLLLADIVGVLDDVPTFATAMLIAITLGGIVLAVTALMTPRAEPFDEDAARAEADASAALVKSLIVPVDGDERD